MTYRQKHANYEVKIGDVPYKWFVKYEKAVEEYNFLAQAPDELEGTLTLVDSRTGEILMSCEPEA